MSNRIFCKIKRQNALFLKFRQPKRKFISSRDKFGIVFFCSLSKNMNKITAIELFTGAFRQTWLSETLFQISIHLFFEFSNMITNSPKMRLVIKKWKFEMKPHGRTSVMQRRHRAHSTGFYSKFLNLGKRRSTKSYNPLTLIFLCSLQDD